jgi:hypothetical protein
MHYLSWVAARSSLCSRLPLLWSSPFSTVTIVDRHNCWLSRRWPVQSIFNLHHSRHLSDFPRIFVGCLFDIHRTFIGRPSNFRPAFVGHPLNFYLIFIKRPSNFCQTFVAHPSNFHLTIVLFRPTFVVISSDHISVPSNTWNFHLTLLLCIVYICVCIFSFGWLVSTFDRF